MSSKYSEYLNLYLYLQIWKSTCTWLKYFEKYLTPTLPSREITSITVDEINVMSEHLYTDQKSLI